MDGHGTRNGLQHERRRARLRALGTKAEKDPRSLSLKDLDDICDLVAKVCSPTAPIREPAVAAKPRLPEPFVPLTPEPHLRAELQALLRVAHAAEYVASHVYGMAKAQQEVALDAKWKTEGAAPATEPDDATWRQLLTKHLSESGGDL